MWLAQWMLVLCDRIMKKILFPVFAAVVGFLGFHFQDFHKSHRSPADAGQDYPFYVTSQNPQQVRVIHDGLADLELRLEMIERAQDSIAYETYIFTKDDAGKLILEA